MDEIFTISKCIPRFPPVYKMTDFDGESIEGNIYGAELQKVTVFQE